MTYRCTRCDTRIAESDAHPPTEDHLVLTMRKAYPDDSTWAPEIGPQRAYHSVSKWHSDFGEPRRWRTFDCGPLRVENEGDVYIDWALRGEP